MRRTEQLQGLRLMKFEDVYGRCYRGDLSQAEASEILGMSERTFRRWRERYEAEGAEGLYDRRLGRVSARRAPVDEVMRVLELFETRYPDFTAKHFHEKLVCEHGFGLSYNWLRLSLQAHGKIKPASRRGAHRRKRPRRPVVGMMLHQDGSSHEWVAGQWWDLIVTMDDATSEVYSGFFVAEEGTMSTFRGLGEVIAENGLFCSLYADRASHYWHTPEAGGGVDKDNPTQVGRALAQLGIELIAAYSPQARGRSERMFGTLQKRLPQELRLAGIATMAEANRFLEELFWPAHNARFARPAADTGSAFVAFAGTLEDILCAQEDRVVAGDNTVRYKNRTLQIPADRHRHHEGRLARRATAPLAAGARAAEVSIVHLHPPRQRRVCLAPRHHRHDLVLHGPGGRLLDPETAPQLDRGNPVLRRYDQVDGREPQRQRQLGGVEDRARRGGCLLLAPVALVEAPARQHTMPAMAAGGADEAVRPAQPGQCRAALLLGAEGFAKRLVAQPAHPRCNLEPHIRNLPRQERTKNICLPKRSVTDKQDSVCYRQRERTRCAGAPRQASPCPPGWAVCGHGRWARPDSG